jgi:hypothetical protein
MFGRKMIGTMIAGIALGAMALPLAAFAAADTTGLTTLNLQGVGSGALAAGSCTTPPITCAPTDTCECLTGTETVVGTKTFNKGSFNFALSVDTSSASLPISSVGDCLPATGVGTLKSSNGKTTLSVDISGFACPTISANTSTPPGQVETFNGTYFVTTGTAPGKQKPFTTGTGAINGAVNSSIVNVSISGNVQP